MAKTVRSADVSEATRPRSPPQSPPRSSDSMARATRARRASSSPPSTSLRSHCIASARRAGRVPPSARCQPLMRPSRSPGTGLQALGRRTQAAAATSSSVEETDVRAEHLIGREESRATRPRPSRSTPRRRSAEENALVSGRVIAAIPAERRAALFVSPLLSARTARAVAARTSAVEMRASLIEPFGRSLDVARRHGAASAASSFDRMNARWAGGSHLHLEIDRLHPAFRSFDGAEEARRSRLSERQSQCRRKVASFDGQDSRPVGLSDGRRPSPLRRGARAARPCPASEARGLLPPATNHEIRAPNVLHRLATRAQVSRWARCASPRQHGVDATRPLRRKCGPRLDWLRVRASAMAPMARRGR